MPLFIYDFEMSSVISHLLVCSPNPLTAGAEPRQSQVQETLSLHMVDRRKLLDPSLLPP